MDGLSIVQNVYTGLRKPSESALPYKTVLKKIQGVVALKKFELALSSHNALGLTSEWFTPSSKDFPMEEVGLSDVLLPLRIEWRGVDSDYETGQ